MSKTKIKPSRPILQSDIRLREHTESKNEMDLFRLAPKQLSDTNSGRFKSKLRASARKNKKKAKVRKKMRELSFDDSVFRAMTHPYLKALMLYTKVFDNYGLNYSVKQTLTTPRGTKTRTIKVEEIPYILQETSDNSDTFGIVLKDYKLLIIFDVNDQCFSFEFSLYLNNTEFNPLLNREHSKYIDRADDYEHYLINPVTFKNYSTITRKINQLVKLRGKKGSYVLELSSTKTLATHTMELDNLKEVNKLLFSSDDPVYGVTSKDANLSVEQVYLLKPLAKNGLKRDKKAEFFYNYVIRNNKKTGICELGVLKDGYFICLTNKGDFNMLSPKVRTKYRF